jgi:pimeloyl-ACP methyl ester carboxylesterase
MRLVPILAAAAFVLVPTSSARAASAGALLENESEDVRIVSEDRLTLVGTYYAPRRSKQLAPGALLVHDAGRQRSDLTELAERLQKQGFGVLVLDLRGHGDSKTEEYDWHALDDDARQRLWTYSLRDLKAGAEFLREQKSIHASSLSLMGHRGGCTLATRHAVRDENVRSLVLIDPGKRQYGFDLQKDIADLGGLPTYIAVSRDADSQSNAKLLAASGHQANGDLDFIQIAIFKGVGPKPIEDKRMPSDIAKWMMERAVPQRGIR